MPSTIATRSQSAPRRSSRLSGSTLILSSRTRSGTRGRRPATSRARPLQVYVDIPEQRASKRRRISNSQHVPSSEAEAEIEPSSSKPIDATIVVAATDGEAVTIRKQSTVQKREELNPVDEHETSLRRAEADLAKREQQLEAQMQTLTQLVGGQVADKSKEVLTGLEENYGCPLCLDIIACPYSLVAYRCGHAFCAICLIKWLFSRLHSCGSWHETIDCPLCRSSAIPFFVERQDWSFPFIPNRAFDNLVAQSVDKLRAIADVAAEALQPAPATTPAKKKGKKKASIPAPPPPQLPAELTDWADGGPRREDWKARDKLGREAMEDVITRWVDMEPADFLLVKHRLAV